MPSQFLDIRHKEVSIRQMIIQYLIEQPQKNALLKDIQKYIIEGRPRDNLTKECIAKQINLLIKARSIERNLWRNKFFLTDKGEIAYHQRSIDYYGERPYLRLPPQQEGWHSKLFWLIIGSAIGSLFTFIVSKFLIGK